MKKIIAVILVFVLLCSLVSCANSRRGGTGVSDESTSKHEKKSDSSPTLTPSSLGKLEEEIEYAEAFSDGLAFVKTKAKNKYFINKEFEIVINLTDYTPSSGLPLYSPTGFINGFSTIDDTGSVIDKKGKITHPEDVGATHFYDCTLESGYLLALVMEANYAGTTKKMGVLDLDFKWVIPPSEDNYKLLCKSEDSLANLNRLSLPYSNLCYKDYLYVADLNQFLNLKDFTLHETWEYDSVPETWRFYTMYSYKTINGSESDSHATLDLSTVPNIHSIYPFSGDRAVVTFANQSAGRNYFTLIDSKGNFCFEPVSDDLVCAPGSNVHFDGDIILVENDHRVRTYDSTGKLLGNLQLQSTGYYHGMEDGIITIGNTFYDRHLTPLF